MKVEFEGDRPPITLELPPAPVTVESLLRNNGIRLNTRCGNKGLCHGCELYLKTGDAVGEAVKSCQLLSDQLSPDTALLIPDRSLSIIDPQIQVDFQTLVRAGRKPLYENAREGDFGLAIDIGTTTVVATLIDFSTGLQVASESSINQQVSRGDNVITRIDYCTGNPEHLREMCDLLHVDTLQALLLRLFKKYPDSMRRVAAVAVAGNTTMLHFMASQPPDSLGRHPFTPVFTDPQRDTVGNYQLAGPNGLDPSCPVFLLPSFAAFIGADIFAGALTTGMFFQDESSLLIDVGTNGELLLSHDGKISGCATAAGPAFEGGGLRHGSRALPDTVAHLHINEAPFSIEYSRTTTSTKPIQGICGSAYIDFIAEAYRAGLLNDFGRFTKLAAETIPPEWYAPDKFGKALRIDPSSEICITEADIALILQAKAAIAAGVTVLLDRAGVQAKQLKSLFLAGGFGFHLDVPNALRMGLFPGFKPRQVKVVGNSSLGGACLSLIDKTLLEEGMEQRSRVNIFELNTCPDFEDIYIDNMQIGES